MTSLVDNSFYLNRFISLFLDFNSVLMKKSIFLLVLFISTSVIKAQDTTVIQTLTFSDINKRRDTWLFPDSTNEWRKIILSYTLKCDPATTWDNYDCGEWDYLTYAFVHQHTGLYDSTALTHPWFKVGTLAPDTVNLLSNPIYNYFFNDQYQMVYDVVNSENDFVVGAGASLGDYPFTASKKSQRAQYLYKATELTAAGLTAGTIDRLRFDISTLGSNFTNFKIRMRLSSSTALANFDNTTAGWTTVYFSPLAFSSTGTNNIDFITPFTWNGTSNILIEFSYENASPGTNHTLTNDVLAYNAGVISDTLSAKYLEFTGNKYVNVENGGFSNITNEVTISFWMYGDPASQPEDGTIFEGINAAGQRVLNSHLPWSNGRVYWDAGTDEFGYDRIDKAANTTDYEGKWNHWAFTKNATTGNMKIFLNGVLWHNATGKTKPMNGVDEFKIGANFFNTYGYHGKIDEFCIFNKELSTTDISTWMNKHIDGTHPFYSNLLYYFSFEENGGDEYLNEVNGSLSAYGVGMPMRRNYDATELLQVKSIVTERPKTTFVRGSYTSHYDTLTVTDSLMHEENSLHFYQVNGNDVEIYDTVLGWEEAYSYEYNNGVKTDSAFIGGGTQYVNDTLNYFGYPFEILEDIEIGRFITPYGINLSLGPNGFEWRYDITDYADLFVDSVEISAGNTQELIDMKFIMISGTPPADVIQIDQLWNNGVASYSYANLDNDVNLSSNTVTLNPATSEIKLKTRLTGHGHNSNDGSYPHCCEWKDNTHYLFANGNPFSSWHIWRDDCAENPVFPQGGTWPGQREGWCPGDVVYENEFRLTDEISSGQITLDYDITPVPTTNLGMGGGNYVTAMHLIEYGAPNFALDAEVYDVIRPNDWDYQGRKNPICFGPKVVLRNNGSTVLTSCTFSYQVSGGTVYTYNWTGSLEFLATEEITLPINYGGFWVGDGSNNFMVTVSSPNGATDLYADNDTYTTHFDLPDMYADNFVVQMKTNNYPTENNWTIKDIAGNVVMNRNGTVANTTYRDTLNLDPGCYVLELNDAGEDGLSYWANSAQGTGNFRLYSKTSSTMLKNFGTDFGKSIHYAFTIGNITYIQENGAEVFAEAFPNPTNGKVTIATNGFEGNCVLEYYDQTGKLIGSKSFNANENANTDLDLSNLENGIYFYSVRGENNFFTGKLVLQK